MKYQDPGQGREGGLSSQCATSRRYLALRDQESLKVDHSHQTLLCSQALFFYFLKIKQKEKIEKLVVIPHRTFGSFHFWLILEIIVFVSWKTVFEFSCNHDLPWNDRGKNEKEILQENKGNHNFKDSDVDCFCFLIISLEIKSIDSDCDNSTNSTLESTSFINFKGRNSYTLHILFFSGRESDHFIFFQFYTVP